MLTPDELKEFKRLVFEVYGIELTDSQALDQGSRLIMLYEALIKMNKKTINNLQKVVQNNE